MRDRLAACGVRNLKHLTAGCSSARVLNLHHFWRTASLEPDYHSRPFFDHPVLNRSIILKHNVRPGEEGRFTIRRQNATKVVLPFDANDLGCGGQYFFVGQNDFVGLLARNFDYSERRLDRDVALLLLLDRLPSLDPFLLSQAAALDQHNIAPCYFNVTPGDAARMSLFVTDEIEPLVRMCLGGHDGAADGAARLSQLIVSDEDSPELDLLQGTLRLRPAEFRQGVFAWKAFLYYKWRAQQLSPEIVQTAQAIRSMRLSAKQRTSLDSIAPRVRNDIALAVSRAWGEVRQTLALYNVAYQSLVEHQRADTFRAFLLEAPRLFMALGDRMGRIEHITSFWKMRFRTQTPESLPLEDLIEILRDLRQGMVDEATIDAPQLTAPEAA